MLLVGVDQPVAPGDRRPQGLLTMRMPGQRQAQDLVEVAEQSPRWQQPDPRSGELERQGQAVEPSAQRDHLVDVPVVEAEPGVGRARLLDEQPHGIARRGLRGERPVAGAGEAQGAAPGRPAPPHEEGTAAGREHAQRTGAPDQRVDELPADSRSCSRLSRTRSTRRWPRWSSRATGSSPTCRAPPPPSTRRPTSRSHRLRSTKCTPCA